MRASGSVAGSRHRIGAAPARKPLPGHLARPGQRHLPEAAVLAVDGFGKTRLVPHFRASWRHLPPNLLQIHHRRVVVPVMHLVCRVYDHVPVLAIGLRICGKHDGRRVHEPNGAAVPCLLAIHANGTHWFRHVLCHHFRQFLVRCRHCSSKCHRHRQSDSHNRPFFHLLFKFILEL